MLSLIVFIILFLSDVAQAGKQEVLKALCEGDKLIELEQIQHIKLLIAHIKSNKGSEIENPCEKVYKSILDLEPVIEASTKDACSHNTTERVREYYLKYIQPGVDRTPVQNFFLALGFTISKTCKKTMVNSLLMDFDLTGDDWKALADWTSDESQLARILDGPKDYDDLLLVSDVFSVFSGKDNKAFKDGKLIVQTPSYIQLAKLKERCEKRFKPFYERLILPLIRLSNMGINYQGECLKRELDLISSNKEIQTWYRIVYICDALTMIRLVRGRGEEKSDEVDLKDIRILTEEEAKALVKTGGAWIEASNDLEPIIYESHTIPIPDKVAESDVKIEVYDYSYTKSESDRIRSRIAWKVASVVKQQLRKGRLNITGSIFKNEKGDRLDADMWEDLNKHVQLVVNPDESRLRSLARSFYYNRIYPVKTYWRNFNFKDLFLVIYSIGIVVLVFSTLFIHIG